MISSPSLTSALVIFLMMSCLLRSSNCQTNLNADQTNTTEANQTNLPPTEAQPSSTPNTTVQPISADSQANSSENAQKDQTPTK